MSVEEDLREIFKRMKRIQNKLGVDLEASKSNLQPEIQQPIEEPKKPEIKKFTISGDHAYESSNDSDLEVDEEEDIQKRPEPKEEKKPNKTKSQKKSSKKKGDVKKTKTKKKAKGGKSKSAFALFMKKTLKELKKKHPKKTHQERFKMAAGLYKKSKK